MHRSFALALTIAAAIAVQIYIISQPHEHPCPPCDHSAYTARIAELEKALVAADHEAIRMAGVVMYGTAYEQLKNSETAKRLSSCEYKRWLQNGDHGRTH